MATRSTSLAYKHWQRIVRLWPVDALRPEYVSFQHIMQQRLSKITSDSSAATSIKSNQALVSPASNSPSSSLPWNEAAEMRQVNALYLLLEDNFAKSSPMPPALTRPASNPEYYDMLLKELQEAPNRSWFGRIVKRIKGSLRLS